jgi:hypothetical protein
MNVLMTIQRIRIATRPNMSPSSRHRFDKNEGKSFFDRSLCCVPASAPQKWLSGDAADRLFSKSGGTFLSFRFAPLRLFLQSLAPAVGPLWQISNLSSVFRPDNYPFSKRRQKRLSVAPAVVPLWLILNLSSLWRPDNHCFSKRR